MFKIKFGLLISIVFLAGCGSTNVKNEMPKTPSMNDTQLKALLVGKSMQGIHQGSKWVNKISPDGTMSETGAESDTGTYTIKNNLFCNKWKTWRSGTQSCWSITKRANGYYGKIVSGSSESFQFSVK